jgi:hypothetical protein
MAEGTFVQTHRHPDRRNLANLSTQNRFLTDDSKPFHQEAYPARPCNPNPVLAGSFNPESQGIRAQSPDFLQSQLLQ